LVTQSVRSHRSEDILSQQSTTVSTGDRMMTVLAGSRLEGRFARQKRAIFAKDDQFVTSGDVPLRKTGDLPQR
jgi:hypothetical protein